MDIRQTTAAPAAVESLGAGRVLVVVLPGGDELVGCAGALGIHRSQGDPVQLLRIASAGEESSPADGAWSSSEAATWTLAADTRIYSEDLIGRISDLIDGAGIDLLYVCAPTETQPERRQLACAVAEAARRATRDCRLFFYPVTAELQATLSLDISAHAEAKRAALAGLHALPPGVQSPQAVALRDACRGQDRRPPVAAAEHFLALDPAELRTPRPGVPWQSLSAVVPGDAGLPLAGLPLVSVIVRTMGRPELAAALASVAAQTYPNIEVVLVQACGGPALELPQRIGRAGVRLVGGGEPLRRARAANLGLSHARGRYLTLLDDDDWWLPDHLSVLVGRLGRTEARAVYSGVRCVALMDDDWQETHVFNEPFDASRLLVENFIPIHAVLFERSLYDQGCRFDESLDVYEDWDFWMQVGRLTPMLHEARVTAVYRLASGTGFGVTASGAEVDQALGVFFAKWRRHWTEAEFAAVVQRARAAQGIAVMQRQVRVLEGQRDQLSDLNQMLRPRLFETQHQLEQLREDYRRLQAGRQAELALVRAECDERLDVLRAESEQRQAQIRAERDAALDMLAEVHASTSWRLTAPVRRAGLALRSGRRRARSAIEAVRPLYRLLVPHRLRQRLAPATARLVRTLPPAPPATDAQSDPWSDTPYQPPAPLALLRLKKGQLASCAESLVLPTADDPVVSVVMPVYRNLGYTLECLSSIAAHPPRASFELILIDDASGESDVAPLRAVRGIRLIENAQNLGFLRSCNRAAAAARGRYLLFLNNDTQVREGWLDALLEPFADPGVGMTGSKLLYPSGHLQEAGVCMSADGTARLVGLNGNPRAIQYNLPREVDYCSGASVMLERAVFEQLGGFDARFAPAYFEDADLAFQVRALGRRILYQPDSEIVHHLSVTTGAAGDKLARIEANRARFVDKWREQLAALDQVRLISFYLPQFHPIPENDAWWGKGFTEWTNVTRARPNFAGHHQPQLPGDLGFYDLRLPEIRRQQAELAQRYGIHGFCYYYYWFNGHRLLNRPLDEVLASGEPDFPFCVCWANENWSRRWDGRESELLMEQHYSPEDDLAFIRGLLPALADPRYIRVRGRPLLLVYRASLLPDALATTDRWRQECVRAGLPEPYLACVYSFREGETRAAGFDAAVEFPPHGHAIPAATPESMCNPEFKGRFYDYAATARSFAALQYPGETVFRGVMPAWDNTARRQHDSDIFLGATPELYEEWLRRMIAETREQRFGDERLLFVNAWNEWAEGNHLEPDARYGFGYLEATRRALDAVIPARGVGCDV